MSPGPSRIGFAAVIVTAAAFVASCFSITQPTGGGCGGSFFATMVTSSPYAGGGLTVTFNDDGINPIPILQVGDTVQVVAQAPDGCDPATLPSDTWTFDSPDTGQVVITPTGTGSFGMLLKPTHAGLVRLHASFGSGAVQTFRVQVNRRAKSVSVDPADTTLAPTQTFVTLRVTVTDSNNVTITPPWTVWYHVAPTPSFIVPPFDLHTIGSPRLLPLEGVGATTTVIVGLGALRDTAVVHAGP